MAFSFQAYTRCLQHHLCLLSPLTDQTCVSRAAMRTKYSANIRNSTQDICILAIFEYARAYLGRGGCGLSFGLPGGSEGKEFACSAGDLGSIPGLGRSPTPEDPPGERNGYPLQCSCLENSMVRGAWPQRVGHSLVTLYVSPSLSHTHTPLSSKPLVAENFTVQFMSWKRRE